VTTRKTPKTMAELLASAKTTIKRFSVGDKVEGKVIAITSRALVLDIGGKSEGLVAEKAFLEARDFIRKLKVGDTVKGEVIVSETPDGYTIISLRNSAKDFVWERVSKLSEKDEQIGVEVLNVNPNGLIVDLFGLSGFIPTSQLGREVVKNTNGLVGKKIAVKIIDFDKDYNKVVLSERMVSEKEEVEAEKKALKEIKEGEIYEGTVSTVADFGIFVKIPVGKKGKPVNLEGLVHISELSWAKVNRPSDLFSIGDQVKVQVMEKRDGKLALSIKQAKDDPWLSVVNKFKVGQKIKGQVVKSTNFGLFVQLESGIEGLIHMTKIPPASKIRTGDEVNCLIEEINPEEKRISLGLVLTSKPLGYK